MNLELTKLDVNDFTKLKSKNIITKFSDSGVLGSYDFLSQVIVLNSLEKKHIDEFREKSKKHDLDFYNIARKIFPLLSHEQTHWIDNTSTLWGFEFLEKVYESADINNSTQINNKSEFNFYKNKSLYDEIRNIKYPKYYSITGIPEGTRPWTYEYSMGKLFDTSGKPSEYPLFFTKFRNCNGDLISREPFSLCSLFEVSATYQELLEEIKLLKNILKNDELLIEEKELERKYLSIIYNKSLTEYSIAAHKISNELKLTNAIEVYGLSASIAHLSLNFYSDYFEKIIPELIYGKNHVFLSGIEMALKSKDRAVLYMCLCDAISLKNKKTPISTTNIKNVIEEILLDFGISFDEMQLKVEERLFEIMTNISVKYKDDYLTNLLTKGVGRFKNIGIMCQGKYPFDKFIAPSAILGDDYCINPYGYYDVDYEDRYLNGLTFLDRLSSFSDACIYSP